MTVHLLRCFSRSATNTVFQGVELLGTDMGRADIHRSGMHMGILITGTRTLNQLAVSMSSTGALGLDSTFRDSVLHEEHSH